MGMIFLEKYFKAKLPARILWLIFFSLTISVLLVVPFLIVMVIPVILIDSGAVWVFSVNGTEVVIPPFVLLLAICWTGVAFGVGLSDGRQFGNKEFSEIAKVEIQKAENCAYVVGYRDAMEAADPKYTRFFDYRLEMRGPFSDIECADVVLHSDDVEEFQSALRVVNYRPQHAFQM